MQRSISYQNSLDSFLYFILFVGYESLCSIYLFLPPLFAVLFVLFIDALDNKKSVNFIFVLLSLIIYEASMGFSLFVSIIYFTILYKFVIPILKKSINQAYMLKIVYVLSAYIGFFIFLKILSAIFLLPPPEMSYYVFYYMLIEFFIVSLI
jgi:hypothetical protein